MDFRRIMLATTTLTSACSAFVPVLTRTSGIASTYNLYPYAKSSPLHCALRVHRRGGVRALSAESSNSTPELTEPKIVKKSVVGATRWLQLVKLNWLDDRGRPREWDAAERPFPIEAGSPLMAPQASAVAILPVLRMNGLLSEVILISQFRPPLGRMCIEAPAGLVGAGEEYAATAFRELFEETGLRAKSVLDDDDSVLCNDPGITNAACRLLVVEVDANDASNALALEGIESGKNYGLEEEGESIRVWRLPLKGLRTELNRKVSEGYAVDGKLHCFARGLAMATALT